VVVFDRDVSSTWREQGYVIGLDAGTVKLLEPVMQSLPDVERLLRDPLNLIQTFKMLDASNRTLLGFSGNNGVFVDRSALRTALLSGLEVEWNKRFVRYEPGADSTVLARFEDGSQFAVDVLVGADGAQSTLRRQYAPYLSYDDLGLTNVAGFLPLELAPPAVRAETEHGLARWLGPDGNTMMALVHCQSATRATLLWSLSYPGARADWETEFAHATEDLTNEYAESAHRRAQLLARLVERVTPRFPEPLARVVASTPPDRLFGPRQMYSMDARAVKRLAAASVGPGGLVVLLGDAAHATTTQRGLGANTAFADAADLAVALQADDLAASVARYNRTLATRGASVVGQSRSTSGMIHMGGLKGSLVRGTMRVIGGTIRAVSYLMRLRRGSA
jgi:2-polyprenyl-6-methoxyphenol hydroxylase-like FAD-dependent oxidoreductase